MSAVIVVGGGSAGMMSALYAAWNGAEVTLLERNERLGLKLAITGKGRCNITNDCTVRELIEHVPGNGRFLHSAFSSFDSQATINLFARLGLEVKVERGNRVFPISDYAKDVIHVLRSALRDANVKVEYNARVAKLLLSAASVTGVLCTDGRVFEASRVVIATGGVSYPQTGSTGDGYSLARELGHTIIAPEPALVPLETEEPWVRDLQGLQLKNVEVISPQGREFGEMLFTHFGITGPIILSLSSHIVPALSKGPVPLSINLKPALSFEQLDARILRDFADLSRKHFVNSLGGLLPASLVPVVVMLTGIPTDKPVNQITKTERETLVSLLKGLPLTVTKARSIDEAIVTAGGVNTKEINPKTMASKLRSGLFFAGEVIDVNGYTGGFNLQIAWSTGALAGQSASTT
ncbi:MAG: NAD(P)/FAD-dependent oxidoreductase [Peptococcaceae bacterium]|nr:NAD(P)/FAD-dependent oxidoreductase [Peptococcaceae bacterium]